MICNCRRDLSTHLGVGRPATREKGATHRELFWGSGQRLRGGMKLRNNTVRRRSHENLFHCHATVAVWAALIVPLFATIAAPPAAAQITAGPGGPPVTVPPGTVITCTNCVAF